MRESTRRNISARFEFAAHGRGELPAAPLRSMPSVVYETPDLAVPGQALSAAEIGFFQDHGFLVKRGLLDAEPLATALARIWLHLLDRVAIDRRANWSLAPDDETTWTNPRWAPMPPAPKAGPHQGRQRIVHARTTVKLHDLGTASYLLDLLPNNPDVRRVAAALLGDNLRRSERTRGVYAVFPSRGEGGAAKSSVAALVPHTDQVCQQLNACAYLDDVPPHGGAFTVYPGSHKRLFHAHRYEANWSPLETFRDALAQVVAEVVPLELVGDKGDVIFWHGRLVHSPSVNSGERIRWAVFADFTHDRETLSAEEHRRLGQFEWFKDTQLFRDDFCVSADMWRGWRCAESSQARP